MRVIRTATAVFALFAFASAAAAQEAVSILPDLAKTPGRSDPAIGEQELRKGKQELRYTSETTRECAWSRYGIPRAERRRYRLDHSIPLELGGVSDSCDNLWPQPTAESYQKDCLEEVMADLVRHGNPPLPLKLAQHKIATNWIAALAEYGQTLCRQSSRKSRKGGFKK